MTTLSLLNDGDIGTVYLLTFPDTFKMLLKYMGDTVRQMDGQVLKHFKRLNPPFQSVHYLPNDESFILEKMPNLSDEILLIVSSYLGNGKGGRKSRRKGGRKSRSRRKNLINKR
jgi:hypothetical protein